MELRAGYKQTEVGVVPAEWEVKTLGEICRYQNGTSLEKYFNALDGYRVISIGNYSTAGKYVDTGVFISLEYKEKVKKFILNKDELTMILNDKTSTGEILGRVLLIPTDAAFVFNQRTMRLSVNENVLPTYLYFLLNSQFIHRKIVARAKPVRKFTSTQAM